MPTDGTTTPTWNLGADVAHLFDYHFMVNALAAGTAVAVTAALLGWFMVIRRQAFAGHTLSVIAFPGAAAATLAGLPAAAGYFAFCGGGALTLATGARRRSLASESASIATVQALALGLGFLFVSLYHGALSDLSSLLFGTFLGIDDGQVRTLIAIAAAVILALALAGRRLLFASLDPETAKAAGVGIRTLDAAFLVGLGLAVAATSQITGALLVFALLVAPTASAQHLIIRPARSLALTVAIALAVTWLGLACAYYSPYPVGFWITSLSFAVYVLARAARRR